MSGPNVLRKQPSLTVSPPEGEIPKHQKSPSWLSRTLSKRQSVNGSLYPSPHAIENKPSRSVLDAPSANASRTSLASSHYSGEYEPTEAPTALIAPGASRPVSSVAPSTTTSMASPSSVAEPPKIPARHPSRSFKESTASSAFLSVSPAIAASTTSPTLPLTSLYLVSGLPKSPQTWTLADQDSTAGVHHSDGAVGRFWRAEVLGSSVTPGVGKKKRRGKGVGDDHSSKRLGTLSKSDLGKMLSKALKLSFTREVEIVASTLQPASTVHTFTFTLPSGPDGPTTSSNGLLRTSILSSTTQGDRTTANFPYADPAYPRPSSTYLGPPAGSSFDPNVAENAPGMTYHGVCLTVWSHADEERTAAIRRTLEVAARHRGTSTTGPGRMSKYSTASSDAMGDMSRRTRRSSAKKSNGFQSATDIEETDNDLMSDAEGLLGGNPDGAGASTLFLPPNTVFWLPYALTLVSRHPIYDLMRDYLTLSWARFSKDVQSHTLQIQKILEYPAPRAGEMVKLDAGVSGESMEVVCRFPGGLDFGRGLVDVNFTMWPLFQCMNIDNILTICELALAPTGRVLFLSRHPVMLGIAVSTIKYLVELRGWNGIALPIIHARDAKIYLEDPGPWLMGLPTEARYITRIQPEICVCDLDINFVNCSAPPPNVVSTKGQRDKFRKVLLSAFDQYFHPDHSIPSEFKEAFPAGRFRPLCKILTKKGQASTVVAETIRAPDWWHQTKVVQAFDAVLRDKYKKPPLLKRIALLKSQKRPAALSTAELLIQTSIRKRASAFVDARDDLETKIGRLSRRLNFLLTESELWRQKFVSFEEYAETLSTEASELRAKINKEQRESKRLSGLVNITAQEKEQLKYKLNSTESAHREAVIELERMREEMDEMERERSQMIAEVEAQIERALVSMAFSDGMSDGGMSDGRMSETSRPGSSLSTRSRTSTSESHQLMHAHHPHMRSFATGTTLAENSELAESHPMFGAGDDSGARLSPTVTTVMHTVKEVPEGDFEGEEAEANGNGNAEVDGNGEPLSEKALRRFSATRRESHTDGLNAVDYGIAERSDAVAQRMLAIQQKLEAARLESWKRRTESVSAHSESNGSVRSRSRTLVKDSAQVSPTVNTYAERNRRPSTSSKSINANGVERSSPLASPTTVQPKLKSGTPSPTTQAYPPSVSSSQPQRPPSRSKGARTPTQRRHSKQIPATLNPTSSTDDSDDYQSAKENSEAEEPHPFLPTNQSTPRESMDYPLVALCRLGQWDEELLLPPCVKGPPPPLTKTETACALIVDVLLDAPNVLSNLFFSHLAMTIWFDL